MTNEDLRVTSLEALKQAVHRQKKIYVARPDVQDGFEENRWRMRLPMTLLGLLTLASLVFGYSAVAYNFQSDAPSKAFSALGTLFILALFVERAQQVYVGAWRGIRRVHLDDRVRCWRTWQQTAAHYPEQVELQFDIDNELNRAMLELATFQQRTRKYVFYLGLALGVLIAAAGPRILRELVSQAEGVGTLQLIVFCFVDILITGGLIGGGSDALHKVMALITDALDQTRQRVTTAMT